jgi:toluene monooxygenase system protein D
MSYGIVGEGNEMLQANITDSVGPVLQAGEVADAIIAVIRMLNPRVDVIDRGAYLRVLVPNECRITRRLLEEHLGRPFRLPGDLESVMSSFKGTFRVSEEEATWAFRRT